MTVGRMLREAFDEALALVVPVDCAACGADGWELCRTCRDDLVPRPRRHEVGGLVAWSGLPFDGAGARAMRALKGEGRTALAAEFAPALRVAVARLEAPDATFVAVPTSRAAMRRRGYRVTELLARRAGLGIRRLLEPARGTLDQRALDVHRRADNVAGSLRAVRKAHGTRVVIVDDVMTTGATLGEARRALEEGGAEVVGAAVVLATPRRRRSAAAHRFPT